MSSKTNIDFWKKILETPTPEFKELFEAEKIFLVENVTDNKKVLDLGCGTGRNAKTIISKTTYIFGVDSDQLAVNEFNNRFRHFPNVYAEQGGVHDLCYEHNSFDIAVSFGLLTNLSDAKALSFIETARVLKKGGRLLLSTYAETALPARINMYETINAPICDVDGMSGKVLFSTSSGKIISEQFSLVQLETLGQEAGLIMTCFQKIGDLAYLVVFQK